MPLSDANLYLCTDRRGSFAEFGDFVRRAFSGGVDIIQLRDKQLEAKQELKYLEILSEAAREFQSRWAVNDRADIAQLSGADVLHVGQEDISPVDAKKIVLPSTRIGLSTHSEIEAFEASMNPSVDYFAVGPCWPTPTKPGRPAPGLDLIKYVSSLQVDKPWFAIGGIGFEEVPQVIDAGATRIVVVRAITNSDNPELAAKRLKELLPR